MSVVMYDMCCIIYTVTVLQHMRHCAWRWVADKVKSALPFHKDAALKACGKVEVHVHAFLTLTLD
jgi:hypothetical protein